MYRKLKRRDSTQCNPQDVLLKEFISRALLEAFWSWSLGTVKGYSWKAAQMVEFSSLVGLSGPFLVSALLPFHDHCGYKVAIKMLLYSRRLGRYTDHMQYDTIRSFRRVYSNFVSAAPQSNVQPWSLGDLSGRYSCFGANPCGLLWFT